MKKFNVIILFVAFLCSSCQGRITGPAESLRSARDTLDISSVGIVSHGVFSIERDIDLLGKVLVLPEGITLKEKGGCLKNGVIVGNDTKIFSKGALFDHISVEGSWLVPRISTALFKDLSYENALRDVMALTNPAISNRVVLRQGDYVVRAEKNADVCVPVSSNTDLIIDGTVKLLPNDFTNYYIVRAMGENIKISGKGCIVGDKHAHTGNSGEWGMGVDLYDAHHVVLSGLHIRDCWGDCIYVGENSTDVTIENCALDHGRRQGISITKADRVTIRNCEISNVSGTAPEYAIDIEPNGRDTVDNVFIENVEVKNCKGGFTVNGAAKDSNVGSVFIRNCRAYGDGKIAVSLNDCNYALMEKCVITQVDKDKNIACRNVGNLTIKNNTLYLDKSIITSLKSSAKSMLKEGRKGPIYISECNVVNVDNNKEK